MTDQSDDDLVTVSEAQTMFQAGILVAVLREAKIDAFAFEAIPALTTGLTRVVVQVRRADLKRAHRALEQHVEDSVDLDWDLVDVGEREDNLPLTSRKAMPLLPMAGFIAAALIIGLLIMGLLLLALGVVTIRFPI